jgi:hypothetical protein
MAARIVNLEVFRREYDDDRTIGDLYISEGDKPAERGAWFCYTLEDKVRGPGEAKVYGETAIPAGDYEVVLGKSPSFRRVLPRLLLVEGFDGVLLHGGNRPKDSLGCILVAFHKADEAGKTIIYNSAEAALVEKLKGADLIRLRVH